MLGVGTAATLGVAAATTHPHTSVPPVPPAPAAPVVPPVSDRFLQADVYHAEAVARRQGARVAIAVLDRDTGQRVESRNAHAPFFTASLVKVMIAEDVLTQRDQGKVHLSSSDMHMMHLMITRSDDFAADSFWDLGGGNAIVTRAAARYGLHDTHPPRGPWWFTTTSADDMVSLYDQIVTRRSTDPAVANWIVSAMRDFQPTGDDGENQTFGLPTALSREPVVGYKQGWMPLLDGNWIHDSTAIVGKSARYIVAIMASQPAPNGEDPTVSSIDDVAKALFPRGRIGAAAPVRAPATAPVRAPAHG
ncbi:hypothetical protein GCM10023147_36480 [Tsukamurella soli]|uniref:Beta-lactamase class A catalytic domain-containing protein n=1 Tax=Tsukamurella soli TaxID=644556 RepID=A0ABP8K1U2_9ACTN